ncbi:MAG TPA: glycoside hydrolase family 172 protein [Candidatus Bathyarchaeia archaeon]|nr:glycoside hydrolase family 172 protein [Candidatus Bathyarchaeia archaeon]
MKPQLICLSVLLLSFSAFGLGLASLPDLDVPHIKAVNALWVENPIETQFLASNAIVVAKLDGPGQIEMFHFAMPSTIKLGREVILRIYWDNQPEPSVNCPLVDFFCDPAGQYESVETAVLNVRRGFNAYFPMPYRRAARVELYYDGDLKAGPELQARMPCYSYVMYRNLESVPADVGYFHANWRQQALPLGKEAYTALETQGRGKFVGWSVTVRKPGSPAYLVDMNEMWYVDGEETPSVELQGIEDSFGFSWGFPKTESEFLISGYRKYFKGAAAYKFFIDEAIPFNKSLKVTIDFGKNENEVIKGMVGQEGYWHELSSVCYWYQAEPVGADPVPWLKERRPAADDNPAWPNVEQIPTADELKAQGTKFYMLCGRPGGEVIYAEDGYALGKVDGYEWAGWPTKVYHARANEKTLAIELAAPSGAKGMLRLFIIDPDNFGGGRNEEIRVDGSSLGRFESFHAGQWIEAPVTPEMTQDGRVLIEAQNLNQEAKGNAVISIVELK